MFQLTRDEQVAIAIGLLIISIVAIAVFAGRTGHVGSRVNIEFDDSNTADSSSSKNEDNEESRMIYIHVGGEVIKPDVYKLKDGTRLFEVIRLAGLKPGADPHKLNLADVVHDGDRIIVPKKGEPGQGEIYYAASMGRDGLININTASQNELESLTGIGPVYASRIIEYRNKYPFKKIEDIIKVNGIGRKTFESIKDKICVH